MLRVVCFDLWNTLVRSSGGSGASYESVLVRRGIPKEKIFPFVRSELMTRRIPYRGMAEALFDQFNLIPAAGEIEEMVKLWKGDNDKITFIPEAFRALAAVRGAGKIAVLVTNSTKPGAQVVEKIRGQFDYVYISCDEGYAKPDPRVWEKIESWFPTVHPSEFAMVGDREEDDLLEPRRRGWRAVPAHEVESLERDCWKRPTTLLLDTDDEFDEGELRSMGINPLQTSFLSKRLARWEGWQTLDPEMSLIVTSGRGGRRVTDDVMREVGGAWKKRVIEVAAKRVWTPGSEPYATASRIFPDRMALGVRNIILIDNVVSSGSTIRKIHDLNSPWLPGAKWHALVWLAERTTSIPSEVELVPAAECGNFSKREPIASASTLVSDPEVLESFARRNGSRELLNIFSSLKEDKA